MEAGTIKSLKIDGKEIINCSYDEALIVIGSEYAELEPLESKVSRIKKTISAASGIPVDSLEYDTVEIDGDVKIFVGTKRELDIIFKTNGWKRK